MNVFILNIALAVGWSALMGSFTLPTLIIGFILGYGAAWIASPLFGETMYFERLWRVLRLIVLFIYELVVSSIQVVWDVVTPQHLSKPGIIAMPLDAKSDAEIFLVANLISLTPGTLSLDVTDDRETLYVHAMFLENPEDLKKELKDGMERSVIEAMK